MSGVKYTLTYSGSSRDPATITSDGVRTTYTYTANGQVSRESTAATSGGKALLTYYGFTEGGDFANSVNDVNGNVSSWAYNSVTRQLAWTKDALGNQVFYTYNGTNHRPEQIYQNGIAALWFGYENGQQTTVARKTYSGSTAQWQRYQNTINPWGLTTAITVSKSADGENWSSGRTLVENTYDNGYGNIIRKEMANGQYVEYFYDLLDRPTKVVYYNTDDSVQATYCYVYNAQGQLSRQFAVDSDGNETESYTYEYDSLGRIIQSREDSGDETVLRIQQLYDMANRIKSQYWTVEGDNYSETYNYDTGDGSLESMTTAGGQTLSYTYDALKRHTATNVTKNGSTIFTVNKSYYNHATDTTRTTAQVQYYNVRNSAGTLIAGSQYVYDALGNIKQIKESESPYRVLVEYDYDKLNQLVSEEIYTYTGISTTPSSTTINTFTYDTAGNLLKVYENGVEKDEYTYGDQDWQDLLTKFNGTTINYDASGNPLNWYNGNTYTGLTWTMGRQLESLTMETDTENISVEYDYDMSGMRSGKTVVFGATTSRTHEYVYASGKLMRETITTTDAEGNVSTQTLDFVYDLNGSPYALNYTNGTDVTQTYYYITNVQGDVTHLATTDGAVVAEYGYDAWGQIVESAGTMAEVNPLRYRGYYYDAESEFFYVSSRYYDPTVCRFVNADEVALIGVNGGFVSLNLFVYCGNSPVIRSDTSGKFWNFVIGAVVGGIIGGVSAAINGGDAADILIGIAGGALGGLVGASGLH